MINGLSISALPEKQKYQRKPVEPLRRKKSEAITGYLYAQPCPIQQVSGYIDKATELSVERSESKEH